MKFVGLDLGGINSLACLQDLACTVIFQGSTHPHRPSCVLLPLIRKEKIVAGDDALQNERGSGLLWPPIAMAPHNGWSNDISPTPQGRLLIATIWQRLIAGGQWQEQQWHPSDGLPALNKPTPAECLNAEAVAALKRLNGDANSAQVVLAIPNQLPEESQESLLGLLPATARLVWRSVAAAMAWAEDNSGRIGSETQLAVIDAGICGIEISVFHFQRQEVGGQVFQVPVRRLNCLHNIHTNSLLSDSPAPFAVMRPDFAHVESHLARVSQMIPPKATMVVCGPLGGTLVDILNKRFRNVPWPPPKSEAIARGSALFALRLAKGLPTYLDILPSLELFTLTEEHEPNWLVLIPPDSEVSGGEDFELVLPRRAFIEQGSGNVSTWLQRSGETEFRKLTTDLPVVAARNAWVDLKINARSAGGFARLRMVPSKNEFDVFGPGKEVFLNWQSMERVARAHKRQWPVEVKYGWPACGKLYAHRRFFDEFLEVAADVGLILDLPNVSQRLGRLSLIKERVRQTIAPQLAGITTTTGDTAPVNLLVCFSTKSPCEFLESGWDALEKPGQPTPMKDRQARQIANALWTRLSILETDNHASMQEVNALTYILGRMGGYAPEGFESYIARKLYPTSKGTLLFAAGRVLKTQNNGKKLLATIKDKADFCQELNNNWLRMLVYVLYQRPDILGEVSREYCCGAAELCLDQLNRQIINKRVRVIFMNSLRALALLLRGRRHALMRDFLVVATCPPDEIILVQRIKDTFMQARRLNLRPGARILLDRTEEWLDRTALTDEMPPIAPLGEDGEGDDADGEDNE